MSARGDLVGNRYRLDEVIGTGGMATVWRARDEVTSTHVAIKRMHARVQDDPDLIERFSREAQAVSRLSHPAIVRLLDEGTDDQGPYIVFELVEGATLKELIRAQGPMDAVLAASVASQVARGLELAHRSGVIHRDIKSHNVLVTPDGVAKLTDFGIARLMDFDDGGLTRTGTVLGTSDYLAPEQARGLGADGRSDVYALGIVLYECLTGELPFPADTPMGVAQRQVRDPMPDPRSVRPEVPAYLASAVLRATEKDPAARFRTALDMSDALLDVPEGSTGVLPVVTVDEVTGEMLPVGDPDGELTGTRPVVSDADTAIPELAAAVRATRAATPRPHDAPPVLPPSPPQADPDPPAAYGEPSAPPPSRPRAIGEKGGRRWAGLIAGLLILALVGVGAFIMWRSRSTDPGARATPGAASAQAGSSGGSASGSSSGTQVPSGEAQVLPLASVTDVDPGGDNREMPGEVPFAYDGNDTTFWRTEKYATPDFGGVGKTGVGLQLTLQQPAVATRLDMVTKGTGGTFQVLAGPPGADARVVGTGTFGNGQQQVDLTPGAASDTYTLWITEPPPNLDGDGYRAYVGEISLLGTPQG